MTDEEKQQAKREYWRDTKRKRNNDPVARERYNEYMRIYRQRRRAAALGEVTNPSIDEQLEGLGLIDGKKDQNT